MCSYKGDWNCANPPGPCDLRREKTSFRDVTLGLFCDYLHGHLSVLSNTSRIGLGGENMLNILYDLYTEYRLIIF